MTTVIKVLDLMREIERTNHATQNWWPSLKRLLEQQEAVEQKRALDLPETWAENEHPSACIHRQACIFYKPANR